MGARWEPRWVQLTGDEDNMIISYHHNKPSATSPGGAPKLIQICAGNIISDEQIIQGQKYAFEFTASDRKYIFSCNSKPECEAWIDAIRKAL